MRGRCRPSRATVCDCCFTGHSASIGSDPAKQTRVVPWDGATHLRYRVLYD